VTGYRVARTLERLTFMLVSKQRLAKPTFLGSCLPREHVGGTGAGHCLDLKVIRDQGLAPTLRSKARASSSERPAQGLPTKLFCLEIFLIIYARPHGSPRCSYRRLEFIALRRFCAHQISDKVIPAPPYHVGITGIAVAPVGQQQ